MNRLSTSPHIIFLIGFMASGKSHFGKALSQALSAPFYDLDDGIEQKLGKSISSIFAEHGEPYFRDVEGKVLRELVLTLKNGDQSSGSDMPAAAVIATGGGTPCFQGNMEWMNAQGITVWLNPPLEVILRRLSAETAHRPLVQGKQGKELEDAVRQKLADRVPFYRMAELELQDANPDTVTIMNFFNYA